MAFYTIYTHRQWIHGSNWRYIDPQRLFLSFAISVNDFFSTVACLFRTISTSKTLSPVILPPDSSIISPNAIVLIFERIIYLQKNKGRFWFYLIDYKYTGIIFLSNMNIIGLLC